MKNILLLLYLSCNFYLFAQNENINIYTKRLKDNPQDTFALYKLGDYYINLGKYTQAHFFFKEILRLEAQHYLASLGFGNLYFKQKKYKLAIQHYQKSLAYKSSIYNTWILLGDAYHAVKQYDKALSAYKQVLKLKPRLTSVHLKCSALFLTMDKRPQAVETLNTILKYEPKNAYVLQQLADIYAKIGKPNRAIANYLKALKIEPNNAVYVIRLGILYSNLECYQQAYDLTLEASKRIKNLTLLGNLSFYAIFIRDYQTAIKAAKQAIALDITKTNIWLYTNLMHAYLYLGDYQMALDILYTYKVTKARGLDNLSNFGKLILKDYERFVDFQVEHPYLKKIAAIDLK